MAITLAHVNRYYELEIIVHPLCPPDHHCKSPGKVPFDPIEGHHMTGWQNHGQFHMDQWRDWLDYDSSINIGMVTGTASRMVGIDIDNQAGEDIVNRLWNGSTWEYSTGKGRRLLFRHDGVIKRQRLHDGDGNSVEILAEATNNVLPPSEHASGRSYAWTPGLTPRDIEIADLPDWATSTPVSSSDEINSDEIDWVDVAQNQLVKGQRNDTMTRIVGRLMGSAPLTARDAFFFAQLVNHFYGKPRISAGEMRTIVSSISRKQQASSNLDREAWDLAKKLDIPIDQARIMVRRKK